MKSLKHSIHPLALVPKVTNQALNTSLKPNHNLHKNPQNTPIINPKMGKLRNRKKWLAIIEVGLL